MKIKYHLPAVLFLVLVSCGNPKNENSTDVKQKEIHYPEEISEKLDLFPIINSELKLDTVFFHDSLRNHSEKPLTPRLVKLLSGALSRDEYSELNGFYLKEYYAIEEAKKNKKYDEFLEKLDIGMTKNAHCYALGRMEFGDTISALLWRLDFISYEACPYFQGSHYMLTTIANGKILQCLQIAADESAADAPVLSTTLQQAKLSPEGILVYSYESRVEEEDKQLEHMSRKAELKLSPEGFMKK